MNELVVLFNYKVKLKSEYGNIPPLGIAVFDG